MTGEETDTFTQVPVPATLRVSATQALSDGGVQTSTLATAMLPASSIDLGTLDESAVASITISGLAADGTTQVLEGSTLPLDLAAIAGGTVPVFVQRNGQFARMPGPLSDSRALPTLAILQGQYLFVGGGTDSTLAETTQLYDFLVFAPVSSPPTLPQSPDSVAFDGTVGWLLNATGGTYYDFSNSYVGPIMLPAGGGSFADIAGGATIVDENGAQYVVGATRTTGAPSAWVLKIDPNDASNTSYPYGNATWWKLSASRLGASAAWVTGTGLVVAGGSAIAPGAEVITPAGTNPLTQYDPDPSTGGGATALDGEHVLLAGGLLSGLDAGVRVIDLACVSACLPTMWPGLPLPLASAQAFSSTGANVVVVGNEPADGTSTNPGLTHVYALSPTAVTELPTKIAHTNARAIASPLGTLVLVGGASEIESFIP